MDDPSDTPLLATAEREDDEPIEWVLHDVTPRQAVMIRDFEDIPSGADRVIFFPRASGG